MTTRAEVTPAMVRAAWRVVERHWPKVIRHDRIVHAPGPWLQPVPCPAFKEALQAALDVQAAENAGR